MSARPTRVSKNQDSVTTRPSSKPPRSSRVPMVSSMSRRLPRARPDGVPGAGAWGRVAGQPVRAVLSVGHSRGHDLLPLGPGFPGHRERLRPTRGAALDRPVVRGGARIRFGAGHRDASQDPARGGGAPGDAVADAVAGHAREARRDGWWPPLWRSIRATGNCSRSPCGPTRKHPPTRASASGSCICPRRGRGGWGRGGTGEPEPVGPGSAGRGPVTPCLTVQATATSVRYAMPRTRR